MGKNKETLTEENKSSTGRMQRPKQPRKETLSFIPSDCASSATNSTGFCFFPALWTKSKNCSLWKEAGLVRTPRTQSQYSEDIQVSGDPKNPSISINLERLDNPRVPRAISLSHIIFWDDYKEVKCWPRSTTTNTMCLKPNGWLWNTANTSYKRFPDQRKVKHFIRWWS